MVKDESKVFIDSDAFIGLNDSSDALYKKAMLISQILLDHSAQLYTGTNVISEVTTILSQRIGHSHAVSFLKMIRTSNITILHPEPKLVMEAEDIFAQQKSKNVSYADCVSFALMKKSGIEIAFSYDRDFKKNGFKLISEFLN